MLSFVSSWRIVPVTGMGWRVLEPFLTPGTAPEGLGFFAAL